MRAVRTHKNLLDLRNMGGARPMRTVKDYRATSPAGIQSVPVFGSLITSVVSDRLESGCAKALRSRASRSDPADSAGRKPSEIPSRTQSVSAFLPGIVSLGPRFSGNVLSEPWHTLRGNSSSLLTLEVYRSSLFCHDYQASYQAGDSRAL